MNWIEKKTIYNVVITRKCDLIGKYLPKCIYEQTNRIVLCLGYIVLCNWLAAMVLWFLKTILLKRKIKKITIN